MNTDEAIGILLIIGTIITVLILNIYAPEKLEPIKQINNTTINNTTIPVCINPIQIKEYWYCNIDDIRQ